MQATAGAFRPVRWLCTELRCAHRRAVQRGAVRCGTVVSPPCPGTPATQHADSLFPHTAQCFTEMHRTAARFARIAWSGLSSIGSARQDANKRKRKREKTPELGGGFVPLGDSLREHVPVLSTIRNLAPDIRTHPLQLNRPYSAYTYRAYARKYARAAGNTAESISASAPVAAQQA